VTYPIVAALLCWPQIEANLPTRGVLRLWKMGAKNG
jgi:hypothetical protein